MEPAGRIDAAPLFPRLHARLIELLRSLSPEEWERRTVAALWTVKDVAAHLLDGDLRRIGLHRDGWSLAPSGVAIASYEDLVRWIDAVNAEWVAAMRRVSPRILTEMLESSGREVSALFAGLDPDAPAPYGVAWAGEDTSPAWMDVAREYTERWMHQQQIRDAVGRPGILDRELGRPYFDASMRVLPHALRGIDAPEGNGGDGDGRWRGGGRLDRGAGGRAVGAVHGRCSRSCRARHRRGGRCVAPADQAAAAGAYPRAGALHRRRGARPGRLRHPGRDGVGGDSRSVRRSCKETPSRGGRGELLDNAVNTSPGEKFTASSQFPSAFSA